MNSRPIIAARLLSLLVGTALALTMSGCATKALWDSTEARVRHEPATEALRLYRDEVKKDFLVVYQEHSEGGSTFHERAYFLAENKARISNNQRPRFVDPGTTRGLREIPVLPDDKTPAPPDATWFGRLDINHRGRFAVYSGGIQIYEEQLPIYGAPSNRAKRILLTPLAVTADATVVGGAIFLWAWAHGGLAGVH